MVENRHDDDYSSGAPAQALGVGAMIVGLLAILASLTPCAGMTWAVAICGAVLALVGLAMSAWRRWHGVWYPVAGLAFSLIAPLLAEVWQWLALRLVQG